MTRFFTKDHEWIDVSGETARVGITDYAQGQLGDITYADLPEPGATFSAGDTACVIDSVKAASDVYSPLAGTVTAQNEALADEPGLANTAPESDGWLWEMTLEAGADTGGLMDEVAYQAYVEGL